MFGIKNPTLRLHHGSVLPASARIADVFAPLALISLFQSQHAERRYTAHLLKFALFDLVPFPLVTFNLLRIKLPFSEESNLCNAPLATLG